MNNNNVNHVKNTHMTGALFSPVDVRDYKLACVMNDTEIPKTFELSMPDIKNQSRVSSCVAHSIATTIEYFNITQCGDKGEMSTNYIYGNRTDMNYNGEGMYTRKAIANTCKYGDVKLSDFPGNTEVPKVIEEFENKKMNLYDKGVPYRFSSYYTVKSQKEIKTALMKNGPVIFVIPWYDDITVIDGILHTSQKGEAGGHCMVIYGWNEQGWLVQNSWGRTFGNKGKMIMPYDIKIREAYGIVDNIINEDDIKKPYNSKIGQLFAKIINWILNVFRK